MIKLLSRFFVLFLFFFSLYACNGRQQQDDTEMMEEESIPESTYLYNICIDSLCVKEDVVQKNQTFSTILNGLGVSNTMIHHMVQKSDSVFDLRKINAGKLYIAISKNDSLETLQYWIYKESEVNYVVFDLCDTVVYRGTKPLTVQQRTIHAGIERSLWETILKQKASPVLAIKLSEIYESQIDFFEITPQDSFSVIYDEVFVDDSILIDIGVIYAANFVHKGKNNYTFAFYQDDKLNYYDEKGDNMKRAFLKAPLKYSRISSKFTNSRYHPVLKIYRAHHGVDYAAPKGTPVFAIGAGTVEKRAFQAKGGGNYVTIKHPNGYKSTYMHLHGFAKGLHVGQRVGQGELIGYVGSTGLSTGPHLDFRIYKDGKPVNPLTVVSPPMEPLHESLRDSFMMVKDARMKELYGVQVPSVKQDTTSILME